MNMNKHAGVAMAMIVLLGGCQSAHEATVDKAVAVDSTKVTTVKPERKTIVQKTVQPGQIEAFHSTAIMAKVGGYVEQFFVDIGDHVTGPQVDASGKVLEPGQLMAQLSAPELIEELHQKDALVVQGAAEVEQARAAIKVVESMEASAQSVIEECQAGRQRAEASVERWKSEFERVKDLADRKAVTPKLADETDQQYKSAEASRAEAVAKLRTAQAKYQEISVSIERAKAALKTDQAKLNVAKAERERMAALCAYLQIRAPYTGIVTARNIDQGVLVLPAKGGNEPPLFNVIQADTIRLFLEVPEADAVLVEVGRPVTVKIPSQGQKPFSGKVARSGWALRSGTRTLNCEIDVPNPDGLLRPGMYAHVELVVAQRENALALPKAAVFVAEGQSFCLSVSSEGVVTRKPIQTGIRSESDVEIISGLDGSEDVLSANVSAFREGQRVTVSKP